MPKVSVLMPAYNSEKYIADAIESILNQTFSDFEFIIINDGSTDNTSKIVRKYTDKRIKFIDNKKNRGLIAVLNQGLDLCSGEYIARMDSDDISLPTRFTKQVKYLDENPEVGILGTSVRYFDNSDLLCIMNPRVSFIDTMWQCPVYHPSVMMRRSVLEQHRLRYRPEYIHAEDYDLWRRALYVTQIHNLPDVLLRYRWHDNNISITQNVVQVETTRKIKQEMLEFISNIPEIQDKVSRLPRLTKFYTPCWLSPHMRKHHPVRYYKLKRKIHQLQHLDIVFAINNNYVSQLCTTITSILENNKDVSICFYVISTDLTDDSKKIIEKIIKHYGSANIKYVCPDLSLFKNLVLNIDHISIETYFRYIIMDLLPDLERCLYLDADLIINRPLLDYYYTDLADNYCAGSPDGFIERINHKPNIGLNSDDIYINAGVMLMNLSQMRLDNMSEKLFNNTRKLAKVIQFQDQDIINITFRGRILPVDSIFNFATENVNCEPRKRIHARIIHYTGAKKPWHKKCPNKMWRKWRKYNKMCKKILSRNGGM